MVRRLLGWLGAGAIALALGWSLFAFLIWWHLEPFLALATTFLEASLK